jgi:hypothetical protein
VVRKLINKLTDDCIIYLYIINQIIAIGTQAIRPSHRLGWLNKFRSSSIGCGVGLALTLGGMPMALSQQNADLSTPEICEVDLSLLKSSDRGADDNIVTADTVSAKGMTIPSLWWTSEEFPAKLVTNWIADRRQHQIYLLVNTQSWNGLDYLERYQTLDRFGRVAQSYGYNLKICNSQKFAIANYHCPKIDLATKNPAMSKVDRVADRSNCQIWFDTSGQNGMGVNTK